MKPINRAFSLLLALLFLLGGTTVYSSASDENWAAYYNSIDNTLPLLTPGADETQLILTWHAPVADANSCYRG